MKKLIVLMLILAMSISIVAFAPLISAENDLVTASEPTNDSHAFTNRLNVPISNDVNYYINISKPSIFATCDKVLAVVQGNDILVKIDKQMETIKDAATYVDGTTTHKIKSINIDKYIDNNSRTYGYLYLTYFSEAGDRFFTKIYRYKVNNNDDSNHIYPIESFSDYFANRNITPSDAELATRLDKSAADFCFVNGALYILSQLDKAGVYKILDNDISLIPMTETSGFILNQAKNFTVNEDGEIFVYTNNSMLYLMQKNSDSFKELNYKNADILDIFAINNKLYLLTPQMLMIRSKDLKTIILDKPTSELTTESDVRCLAFDVTRVNNETYISFALTNNNNILTYKENMNNGKFSLDFYNHYGSNCTCVKPCQGWLNSPSHIATTMDESIIYVVDNKESRLVAMRKEKSDTNYTQYFFNTSDLNIPYDINRIAIDRKNNLFIGSNNRIYVYRVNNNWGDEKTLPFSRIGEITDLDGSIVDMKMLNHSTSTAYILTDKNSVYMLTEDDYKARKIVTFNENIVAINPSNDGNKIYTATADTIKSYALEDIDITTPITTIKTEGAIKDFVTDNAGNIFVLHDDNRLRVYNRIEDNEYRYHESYVRVYGGKKELTTISSFYIAPQTKHVYFTDNELHIAEISKNIVGYTNENDIYKDENKFDNTLQYVAKTTADAKVYTSPINFENYRMAQPNEYFYVLAVDKTNENMYLVVDKDNNFRYIKKTLLSEVPSTTDCIYGNTFVPLHGTTNIYPYPFENDRSTPIEAFDGSMFLIHNVAYENKEYVWQTPTTKWFKVSYTNSHNMELTGYVKMREISKSTRTTAPATKIHLRVKTKAGETVNMYDMPDLASGILEKGIINGTLVRLVGAEFDIESEFTEVQLEKKDGTIVTGFILTKNLQKNTFTTLQIVAIVVSVITVLITILVIVLIVQYRKKRNNTNNFKSDEEK